ncbi:hypothetical protein GCM10028862_01430 [Luteimonas pelagia]
MRIPIIFIALAVLAACGEQDGAGQFVQAAEAASDDSTPTAPASAAIPERFHGTWASDLAHCGESADESHMVLRASDVEFHESGGPVTAVDVDGNALKFTAELTGEGETWMADLSLQLAEDGQSLTDTAVGLSRVRCG